MGAPLTNIANRLTPSMPMEITFGAGEIATGIKATTIFGHFAQTPGSGMPYQVYTVINVGDPDAAQAEVNALAGAGSQIGNMVAAFIKAAAKVGNFPAFRVVLIPYGRNDFGPNNEAINAVMFLRSDMFVTCYPSSDNVNKTTLQTLITLLNGVDRDLSGQFGSFATYGSIDPLATQIAYNANDPSIIFAALPDTNTATVNVTGTLNTGSNQVTAVTQTALTPTGSTQNGMTTVTLNTTAGIYPGAAITDGSASIPANTTVETILSNTQIVVSNPATATTPSDTFTITNLPTAGIYQGAAVTGASGVPALTVVTAVAANSFTISNNATAAISEALVVQNQISQPSEIVAAAHAGGLMASQFPYFPMQGIGTALIPPRKQSDWIAIDPEGASEAALVAGLSPLVVTNGSVNFLRTRTTWTMNGLIPVTAYFDWQDLVTLNDFREDCFVIGQSPPFNNNPGGTKDSLAIANQFKDEVLAEAFIYETENAFQGVKSLAPQFEVAPSQTSRGRFDFLIPVNVLPGLFVIAGNIQGVTAFNFTL